MLLLLLIILLLIKKINNMKLIFRHVCDVHSRRKDGQYLCEYGTNGICFVWNDKISNESDYKSHVVHDHAFRSIPCVIPYRKTSDSRRPTDEWNFYSASQSLATVLNDPRRPRSVYLYYNNKLKFYHIHYKLF